MVIGIDISQIVYKTGVSNYLLQLVLHMIKTNKTDKFILFGSSLRQRQVFMKLKKDIAKFPYVEVKIFPFPPIVLDIMWNKLHVLPIEWFIGKVDVFISSDWTQPPTQKARKVTILYDLIVYRYPQETAKKIVEVQKRRLYWVKKEVEKIICISQSTKKDAQDILKIPVEKLAVIYPGI